MLILIDDADEKVVNQQRMEENVRGSLVDQGLRNIGFPSGNRDEIIYSNGLGALWAAFGNVDDTAITRHWNVFGVFDPKRHAQSITVEINIATASNSAAVAGFFAKDPATGRIYLMHGGRVGGGKPGVGRNAFLAWSKADLVEARAADGSVRLGIIVGNIESKDFVGRLWRFVQLVRGFKDAVTAGKLENPDMRRAIAEWENFNSEGSGRRQGQRKSVIDYVSYHGEVVERLFEERNAASHDGEKVCNSPLIDLYVRAGAVMTEIFEVKTSLDRQSIYTAIGQLICHSVDGAPNIKRTLVVPNGEMAPDLEKCLASNSISVRRFTITTGKKPMVLLS